MFAPCTRERQPGPSREGRSVPGHALYFQFRRRVWRKLGQARGRRRLWGWRDGVRHGSAGANRKPPCDVQELRANANDRDDREKMEPGGIEPPSRDSRSAASTRVSGGLISAIGAGAGALPFSQARGVVSPRRPRASRRGQPDIFDPPLIRRQERIAWPVLGRESVGTLSN